MGFTVENHFDFINIHVRRSSAEMEKVFKELGNEANLNDNHNAVGIRIQSVETVKDLPSTNLPLPSVSYNAAYIEFYCHLQ
jgi:hypothetical protein